MTDLSDEEKKELIRFIGAAPYMTTNEALMLTIRKLKEMRAELDELQRLLGKFQEPSCSN